MKKYLLLIVFSFAIIYVQAHVELNYPVGGETFSPGEEITIEWEEIVAHNTLNWDLLISLDGGETWDALAMDIDSELRSFTWIVPETPSDQARIKVVQDNENFDYEDESEDFTIMSAVGTAENEAEQISIYPNPAIDHIIIDLPAMSNAEISVFDLGGNLVLRNFTDGRTELANLSPGIYFVKIRSEGKILSQKLLIK